ncbi:MAG: sugar phosphate isomerase/epimerase [Oscillospiraceae bacterium]|nr:sugar phosphate isomerase/epimerase [Oscillospiraceae bacterium]
MDKRKIAAQLYTVREFTKTPKGVAETFAKVRDLGYKAVQVSGMGPIDPMELKKIADGNGLRICATHIGYGDLTERLPSVIENHRLWGCRYVGLGAMPGEFQKGGQAGYAEFAKRMSGTAVKLAEAGLSFVYHNHDFEFRRFGGLTGLDVIFAESDPKAFNAELDTYWVQAGGASPAAWIRKLKGRMDVVHLMDMVINGEGKRVMAEIGEGNLDWPDILKACAEIGIEWYIVEQDDCYRDPFESLGISLKNLESGRLE